MAGFPNKAWTMSSINRLLLSQPLMQPALFRATNKSKTEENTQQFVANRVLLQQYHMNEHI